jgi:hypothetical protein
MFYSPIIRKINKLLRYTDVGMSFKTPTPYNSQNQKYSATHKNRTIVEFINLHVDHAKCHTSDRQVVVLNRDITNKPDT